MNGVMKIHKLYTTALMRQPGFHSLNHSQSLVIKLIIKLVNLQAKGVVVVLAAVVVAAQQDPSPKQQIRRCWPNRHPFRTLRSEESRHLIQQVECGKPNAINDPSNRLGKKSWGPNAHGSQRHLPADGQVRGSAATASSSRQKGYDW